MCTTASLVDQDVVENIKQIEQNQIALRDCGIAGSCLTAMIGVVSFGSIGPYIGGITSQNDILLMGYRDINLLDCLACVGEAIREKQLIKHNDHILATLSGGQDSACLGLMLGILKRQLGYQIGYLWCNHLWQRSAFFTMLHLAKSNLSYSSRIGFHVAIKPVLSEQGARDWRHAVIQRESLFYSYDLCAQGHTKSDRVETVFFNLVRGSGLAGISALQWCCERGVLPSNRLYGNLNDFSHGNVPRLHQCQNERMPALQIITSTQVEAMHSSNCDRGYSRDAMRDTPSSLDVVKSFSKGSMTSLLMKDIMQKLQHDSYKSTRCALYSGLGWGDKPLSLLVRGERVINLRSKRRKGSILRCAS